MTLDDGCGNSIEFKGLHKITDVYAVEERETAKPSSQAATRPSRHAPFARAVSASRL